MRWNGKRIVRWCHKNPNIAKSFDKTSLWRKLSMIMVWEHYCNASPKPEFFYIFFVYIFIHISANMSPFGLKFSQMILNTETSKLMYNWSFLFEVLHKPTLLPSTFKVRKRNINIYSLLNIIDRLIVIHLIEHVDLILRAEDRLWSSILSYWLYK